MKNVPVGMNIPERTEEEQVCFFEQCMSRYQQASEESGTINRYFEIADTIVCFSFAGEALIPALTPALSHLQVISDRSPDVTIHVWDSESSGVEMVEPPCNKNHFTDRGDIWGFNSDRIKTAFHWSEFSVNVMDLQTNTAVYWIKSRENLPYWAISSPFRTILHWWMEKNGCQLMHAAAVGTDEGGVLITGKGGAGKSTTAVSCLLDGMNYLSDDYLIVKKDPVPKVYSLYSTAKIGVEDREKFSELQSLAADHIEKNQEKDVLFLYPAFKDQIKKELPVKTILKPRIRKQKKTTFSPISFWRTHRAMSFTTMSQLPGVGTHTHQYFKDLCNTVPCLAINLGNDLKEGPKAIRHHLHNPEKNVFKEKKKGKRDLPLVSVVIPVYNGEKFIEQAIGNITEQNYPAVEIIVVNDGSTDNTEQILKRITADIRYFSRANAGPSTARNEGIKDASGKYIAFLDVDDLWPENHLSLLVDELENNEQVDIVRGYAQLFRDQTDGNREYLGNPKESYPYYIGAGLYRASVFSEVGLFDPFLQYGEDTDWYTRAKEKDISIKWLDEVTLYVRRHGENMTEGRDILELSKLKTFKKALDRRRSMGKSSGIEK